MGAAKFDVMTRGELLADTGIATLQKMIDGALPRPPIMETLDFRLVRVADGEAFVEGSPEFRLYNPLGSVHGGYAATLLDTALACAIHTKLDKGEAYTTIELKLNYVRALTEKTGKVRAEGKVIHRGRTLATSEGRLLDEQGRLYVHATTTCMIFPAAQA